MSEETVITNEEAVEETMPTEPSIRKELKKGEYIATIGRRKTATAQVRLSEAKARKVTINGRDFEDYFKTADQRRIVLDAMQRTKTPEQFEISVLVKGGGLHAQAEAVRHGIARAMTVLDSAYRSPLKKFGFLKRDPRSKERKKFGLRGARRRPQWSKR